MALSIPIDTGWHPLAGGNPPVWASGWGKDPHGVFAEFTVDLPDDWRGVIQRMRWIPAGRFMMGSPEDEPDRHEDEGPQVDITFRDGFWMMDTAVTQALWTAIMGENPSHSDGNDRPVVNVSWTDAITFIDRLNGRIAGLNLRLPSEAEWEYTCRAGTTSAYAFGDTARDEEIHLALDATIDVKAKPPNAWGLYQMHGNVWEWCADAWSATHEGADSAGKARAASSQQAPRVFRGGSCDHAARDVRSAVRNWFDPGFRSDYLGVRCAGDHVP